MSPEQRAAADALKRGVPVTERLDGQSDIYSLGVLLYESLAGRLPAADWAVARRNLHQANPQISHGIEDVLCKCLRILQRRYRDAGQLATDLRAIGQHALARSCKPQRCRRWQKWRRRKPHAMALLVVGLAATAIVCGVGGLFYRDRVRFAEAGLLQSQRELEQKEFAPSIQHAEAAAGYLHWIPWQADLKSRLKKQAANAKRAQAVAALRELVDQLRFLDIQQISHQKLAEIAAGCQTIWQSRGALVPRDAAENEKPADGGLDEQLRRDLIDLAILSARLEVRSRQPQANPQPDVRLFRI